MIKRPRVRSPNSFHDDLEPVSVACQGRRSKKKSICRRALSHSGAAQPKKQNNLILRLNFYVQPRLTLCVLFTLKPLFFSNVNEDAIRVRHVKFTERALGKEL